MEKTSRGAVVPANTAWSGVGSWRVLAHEADANRQHHRRPSTPENFHLAAPNCPVVAIGLDAAATTTACSTTASRTRHIEGVPHFAQKGKLYGGFGTIKPTATKLDVHVAQNGIVARDALADLARFQGRGLSGTRRRHHDRAGPTEEEQ